MFWSKDKNFAFFLGLFRLLLVVFREFYLKNSSNTLKLCIVVEFKKLYLGKIPLFYLKLFVSYRKGKIMTFMRYLYSYSRKRLWCDKWIVKQVILTCWTAIQMTNANRIPLIRVSTKKQSLGLETLTNDNDVSFEERNLKKQTGNVK